MHSSLQELTYESKFLTMLQKRARGLDNSNRYRLSPNRKKSAKSCQQNWTKHNVSLIWSPDCGRQPNFKSDIGLEVAILNPLGRRASSEQSTPGSQSTKSADDALYSCICSSQLPKVSKCTIVSSQALSVIMET